MNIEFDAASFSGVIPVFPLPEVVLFPFMVLPLHIFEARYRQMVAESLEGEKLIGMAMLKPGWENDYYGTPPINECLGMGKIVKHVKLDDGRYNILLMGVHRVEVVEMVDLIPFRRAKIRLLGDEWEGSTKVEQAELKQSLLTSFKRLHELAGKASGESTLELVGRKDLSLGLMTDALSGAIPLKTEQKQALLEELNVLKRARWLARHIESQICALELVQKRDQFDKGDPKLN